MDELILAIVTPCYNEEDILVKTNEILNNLLDELKNKNKISSKSYITYIDDGSNDSTWDIIKSISDYGIKLSRNFGQQNALLAGILENDADIYISIDVDLQDDISVIEQMIDEYNKGNQVVYGVKNNRETDTFIKRFCANSFYQLCNFLEINTIPQHSEFRLISKKIVNLLRKNTESNIYLRGRIPSYGFKHSVVYYKRMARIGGESKYNLFKLINLAINGITSFSIKPLRFISLLGSLSFLFAIIITIYAIYEFINHNIVPGWTSLFVSIYFLGGIQLLSIGIVGEYIGKIYTETKKQPLYLIEEAKHG